MFYLILKKGKEVLTSSVYSLFIVRFTLGFLMVSVHCFSTLWFTEHSNCAYLIYHQVLWALSQLPHTQPRPFSSSVSGARGERETVEASPGGPDWEGPFNLRQHATEEGSLVQPGSHVPTSRHQVAMTLWLSVVSLRSEMILIHYNDFNTLYYCLLLQQEWRVAPESSHLCLAR